MRHTLSCFRRLEFMETPDVTLGSLCVPIQALAWHSSLQQKPGRAVQAGGTRLEKSQGPAQTMKLEDNVFNFLSS